MAQIHTIRDYPKKKPISSSAKRMQSRAREARRTRKIAQWSADLCICLLVACAAAFVYLLLHPEFARNVAHCVGAFLENCADGMGTYGSAEGKSFLEMGFFEVIIFLVTFVFIAFFRLILGFLLSLLALIIPFIVWILIYALPIVLGAAGLWGFLYIRSESDTRLSREEEILKYGLEWERVALDCLRPLSDECHIFTRLYFSCGVCADEEADLVVVTPAGITIINAVYGSGTLVGDASDQYLTLRKKPFLSNSEEDRFLNPITQQLTAGGRIAEYFQNQGIPAPVRTCVFFVEPEVEVQLSDQQSVLPEKCPVFTRENTQQLLQFLDDQTCFLAQPLRQRAVELLEGLLKEEAW